MATATRPPGISSGSGAGGCTCGGAAATAPSSRRERGAPGAGVIPPLVSACRPNRHGPESGFSPETPAISRHKLESIADAYGSETRILQGFLETLGIPRSACHAEGRGFESLQPLRKRPAFAGLFRWSSRLVRLHPVGLIPDSRPADHRALKKNARFAGRF
jgi:hypothetical protein